MDDDGTVSSRTWQRPSPAKPQTRVWRPPIDTDSSPAPSAHVGGEHPRPDQERDEAPAAHLEPVQFEPAPIEPPPPGPTARKDPTRKGGIHFDDDEDLSEYMHPDDVPPKTPPDGDS